MKQSFEKKRTEGFVASVGQALRRAAKAARKVARAHGTPIYVVKNEKTVAEKP
ncbi:MAG: hypothetical protein HY299_00180 [Verrucomicrobia bacterium]|nr:hypothetical protein [Verrucomicrobiota bacterium]